MDEYTQKKKFFIFIQVNRLSHLKSYLLAHVHVVPQHHVGIAYTTSPITLVSSSVYCSPHDGVQISWCTHKAIRSYL